MSAIRTFSAALSAGLPIDRAKDVSAIANDDHLATVEQILDFAQHTGAPRTAALDALADSIDSAFARDRAVTTGSATARQTTRILTALPVATAAGAQLFGFDVVVTLVSTPLGLGCATVGAGLTIGAHKWMNRIQRSLIRPSPHTGLVLDLSAAAARTSGLNPTTANRLRDLGAAWHTEDELTDVDNCRRLSRETGVPVAGLLDTFALLVRQRAGEQVAEAIELLPGKLLAPVGACLFPAFVVTTVIPVVASMATAWTR